MNLTVFDDKAVDFYPVSFTRSVGDVRCGILKLRQRLQALLFGENESVLIEKGLENLYRERHPDWMINRATGDTLYVNSRMKLTPESLKAVKGLKTGQSLRCSNGTLAAVRSTVQESEYSIADVENFAAKAESVQASVHLYNNMADIIMDNSRLIEFDFEQFFHDADNFIETEPGVTILNPYQVWIGQDVLLKPGVVIDASGGPVVIDEKAEVMANSVIIGPVYIGKKTIVKVGSKIYGGTSIGPVCKIGGEIEGSIIQAYSNKQHDGFLGHAYLGEWINLGAGTNNSDLKNNYKSIAFYSYQHKAKVQSGYQFLGSIIADHTKTGINCTLNTGVMIGVGCNIWGKNIISDFVPSFSWGEAGLPVTYDFEAFTQTAKLVKQRRNLELTDIEIDLVRTIWKLER